MAFLGLRHRGKYAEFLRDTTKLFLRYLFGWWTKVAPGGGLLATVLPWELNLAIMPSRILGGLALSGYLLCLLTSCTPKAAVFGGETGRFGASFDHYAINVDDVDETVAFYQRVLALEEVYDGTEKDNISWLSLGNGMSLHVIESDRSGVSLQKGVHLSIAVREFDRLVQHLRDINLQFFSWQGVPMQSNGRPDGVRQVYFKDLDGYWTEVNDARVVWEQGYTKTRK